MAITIAPLIQTAAPLIIVYGAAGIGKTSLALNAPNPIYLRIKPEAPPRNLRPATLQGIVTFMDVMTALRMVYKDPGDYQTLVIDSITAMETLVWDETCIRNKWKDIEAIGYGKGYLAADDVWREVIKACDAIRTTHNILIFMLCHSETSRVDEPGLPPFNKFGLRLQHRAENLMTQAADATLFMYNKATIKAVDAGFNKKISHAESGGLRWLACDGRAHFIAKNRLGLPDELMLDIENPFAALEPYLTPIVEESPLEPPKTAPTEAPEPPATLREPAAETPLGPSEKPPLTIPPDPPFVEGSLPKTTEETSKEVLDGDDLGPLS